MDHRPPKPPSLRHRKPISTTAPPPPIAKASDALPLPLYLTNAIFFTLFFSVSYFLLHRWRDKIRSSTPLHVVTLTELTAIVSLIASFIYLLGFFGIGFVQSFTPQNDVVHHSVNPSKPSNKTMNLDLGIDQNLILAKNDEDIVNSVVSGAVSSYSLETKLGDCRRAASIRRMALERKTGKELSGLPLDGFDYESILGQCCEMPIGYVQVPVGVAGPLLLNGDEFMVPMATSEGCLVASTNRGCKAVFLSGGATAVLLKDGMTRAPVVRFGSVARAASLKFFLEDPINFDTLSIVFNK